jgi:hypothetical protein
MSKIGYFTAGPKPTNNEQSEIDALAAAGHDVMVRDVTKYTASSYQPAVAGLEEFDYVRAYAGTTYPADYDDTGDFPVADPAAPPSAVTLPGTQKLLSSGVEFLSPAITGSRTDGYTPTISGGVVTALAGS